MYATLRPRGLDTDRIFELDDEPMVVSRDQDYRMTTPTRVITDMPPYYVVPQTAQEMAESSQLKTPPDTGRKSRKRLKTSQAEVPSATDLTVATFHTAKESSTASYQTAASFLPQSTIMQLSPLGYQPHTDMSSGTLQKDPEHSGTAMTASAADFQVENHHHYPYQERRVQGYVDDSDDIFPFTSGQPVSKDSDQYEEETDYGSEEFPLDIGEEGALVKLSAPEGPADGAAIVSSPAEDEAIMLEDYNDENDVQNDIATGSRSERSTLLTSLYDILESCACLTPVKDLPPDEVARYQPLGPFARPNFAPPVLDRSPILGVTKNLLLRTCYRIGELIREGGCCGNSGQDAIFEVFARVRSSSRERSGGTTMQIFELADLFHAYPPYAKGVLENCKAYGLQEVESRQLLGEEGVGQMVRVVGRWKRGAEDRRRWCLHVINIRASDWEEVRWTREMIAASMVQDV